MRAVVVVVAVALVGCQPVDRVDVLAEARAASGGAAWDAVHSLHITSTLVAGGRDGRAERWQDVAAGRFVREVALPPTERSDGFDGVAVWTSAADGTAYALGDDDARLGAIDAAYLVARGWTDREHWPAAAEPAGEQGGFDRVVITPAGGRPFTLWIDRETHLIDRVVEQHGDQLGVTRFADYRRVGGLVIPYTIRQGDGDAEHDDVETVTAVEIDPAIPDARFSLPALSPASASGSGSAASPVTVPFRLVDNQLLIDVMLDGKGPYEAMFDSGGSLILPPAVVAELGLTAAGAAKETGGGEGYVVAGAGRLTSASIGGGPLASPAFQSFAWDDEHPRRLLAGLEILQRYVVRIDIDAMTMTLTPPAAFEAPPRAVSLPFVFQDNQPEITAAIDGIAARCAVDTGDDASLLVMAPFARRHRLIERYHATVPYGGSALGATSGVLTRVGTVSLDGPDGRAAVHVERPVTRLSTQTTGFDADRYVSCNLGMGILRQFNVTFDYAHQRLLFERSHRYGEPELFNRSGVNFERKATAWTVAEVVAGGPADQAGIRVGDVVSTIDGKTPGELDRTALKLLTVAPVGTTIALGLGGGRTVTLTLRDLL